MWKFQKIQSRKCKKIRKHGKATACVSFLLLFYFIDFFKLKGSSNASAISLLAGEEKNGSGWKPRHRFFCRAPKGFHDCRLFHPLQLIGAAHGTFFAFQNHPILVHGQGTGEIRFLFRLPAVPSPPAMLSESLPAEVPQSGQRLITFSSFSTLS